MQPVIKGSIFITTWVYVVVSAVGTAVSVGTSIYQGQQAKGIADYNAEVEEIKAQDAVNIGADKASDARQRARKIASAQREGGAISGVDIDSGTPLGLLVETAGIGESEALTIMNNAQRQAWGFKQKSKLDTLEGQAARRAGQLKAGGSIITGASSTFKQGLWG